jgi:hypothetical protein
MTNNCENALYHYRHTGLLLFIYIFSYFFYLYQAFLFSEPFEEHRKRRKAFFRIFDKFEFFEALAFSTAFTTPLLIDYFIIRPSFGVTVALYMYFLFLRFSFNYNFTMFLLTDGIYFVIVYYLQDSCYLVLLILFRLICEIFKLMTTYWANKVLKVVKSGGANIIGICIFVAWFLFYLLKR